MPDNHLFADIHCHPAFKPYGQSFSMDVPDPQPTDPTSLWFELEPNGLDERLSRELDVAMYSQSSLKSAAEGGLQIIGLSLGALEKEFITVTRPLPKTIIDMIRLGSHGHVDVQDFFCNLVTRFGKQRIDSVQTSKEYFPGLMHELAFVRAQENKVFRMDKDGRFYTFRIAQSGGMLADILEQNRLAGAGSTMQQPITLCVVLSIEGLHNLDAAHGADEATVMNHVAKLKSAEFPLVFVTFCHHFWNGLCGHAISLAGLMASVFDQSAHAKDGFHPLGLKVLMALLDTTTGRRIPIDIKHMSYTGRMQYYNLLDGIIPKDLDISDELESEVRRFFRFNKLATDPVNATPPVVVSHAAVNGYTDEGDKVYQGNFPSQQATGVENPFENPKFFDEPAINLYDADIISLGRFNCLIGIQLDMRRIAGSKGAAFAETQGLNNHAYLVWNQVIHMVELWDRMDFPNAWDRICIGSDFDGIVCPMEGLQRVSDYPRLREGLLHYSRLYFMPKDAFEAAMPGMGIRGPVANRFQSSALGGGTAKQRLNPQGINAPEHNSFSPEDIVEKICSGNALEFLKRFFV